MKKNYWWRIFILLAFITFVVVDYFTYCIGEISRCFWGNNLVLKIIFHFSLANIFVSFFLFFVSDKTMLRWLNLSLGWIILYLFFIFITPESSGSWISLTPDREQVSIWMSSLFLVISLASITIWSIKDKKSKK